MRTLTACLVWFVLALSGCEPTLVAPTQVLVTVSSDLGSALAVVESAIYDAREQQLSDMQAYAVPAEVTLPFSFAIVPALDKPARTVLVVVTGRDAEGALLAQAKALVTFRDNERIGIEVPLLAACLQQECGALQTCTVSQTNSASCATVEEPVVHPIEEDAATSTVVMGPRTEDASVGSVSTMDGGQVTTLDAGGPRTPSDAAATMDADAMTSSNADAGGSSRDAAPADANVTARDATSSSGDASADGGSDASAQDAAPASPFPRLDQPATIAMMGPYTVASYSDGLENPSYGSPIIYYPTNAAPPFAGVAVMQAFGTSLSQMAGWGPFLASHGIVSLHVETSATGDEVPERADDLDAQLATLRAENSRAASPLRGKIDPTRLAVFGFNMGGGAALVSANRNTTQVRAAVAFEPWTSASSGMMSFPQVTAPTLVFGGAADNLAPPATYAYPFYQSVVAPKAYFEIVDLSHLPPKVSDTGPTRMIVAWLKIYLEGDTRYETYISGAKRSEIMSQLSRVEAANR